jgi:hypothetical protein
MVASDGMPDAACEIGLEMCEAEGAGDAPLIGCLELKVLHIGGSQLRWWIRSGHRFLAAKLS